MYKWIIGLLKKINKRLDYLYDKTKSFYSKFYKDNNSYFLNGKFLKHSTILSIIINNIHYLSIKGFMFYNILINNILFISSLLLVYFIVFLFEFNGLKKASKLSDEQWNYYKNLNCYHITSCKNLNSIKKGSNVYLKQTIYYLANLHVFFKKSVYFFSSIPNESDIKIQVLTNKNDLIVTVPIKNLNRNKLRIRNKANNVLVYKDKYIGPGKIEAFK